MTRTSFRHSPWARTLRWAALAIPLVVASTAAAQPSEEADAERLFREGQKLLEQRRFGEACPKFDSAYQKDGQLGTLLNLAFCHKEQGAKWFAWLEFREAEIKAEELGREDNQAFAHKQRVALEKPFPKLVVDNPDGVPLTDVLVEERRVPKAEAGEVFVAEAGERKVTFVAKGKKPATLLVEVARSAQPTHVTIPPLEDADPEPAPVAEAPAKEAPPPPPQAPPSEAEGTSPGRTQRTLAYVALGVGAAGLVAGGITGAMTLGSPCAGGTDGCTRSERDAADGSAMLSNISFAVAGVGLVGGLALLLTAPHARPVESAARSVPRVEPRIGAGWAGLDGVF